MPDLHRTEDRADLEDRFRILAGLLQAARERTDDCLIYECTVCSSLRAPVALPATVLDTAHEPREDLEQATEEVVERLTAVMECADAWDCPAGSFTMALIRDVQQRHAEPEADGV